MMFTIRACWIYLHAVLGIPLGTLHTAVPAVAFGIDMYYRIEWFDLHTPLHAILAFMGSN